MSWRREVVDGFTFYRRELTRYGELLALVVGPTTNGRWQARCGGAHRGTRDIADLGDYLTTEATADGAKRVASGRAEGV